MSSTSPKVDCARDFRAEAVATSLAALAAAGIEPTTGDLTVADFSLCTPTTADPIALRRQIAITLGIIFSTNILLFIVGGLLVFTALHPPVIAGQFFRPLIAVGAFIGCAGWIGICSSVNVENVVTRLILRRREAPAPRFQPSQKRIVVKIENPRTCRAMKLVVEDLTLLSCDAFRRLFIL